MSTANSASHDVESHSATSVGHNTSTSNETTASCNSRLKGYPMLASQMETQPEMALFRRFGALNAQNLLYLQAELVSLEQELSKQQLEDHNCNHEGRKKYALNWCRLRASQQNGDTKQLDLVLKIRKTLRLYSKHDSVHVKRCLCLCLL